MRLGAGFSNTDRSQVQVGMRPGASGAVTTGMSRAHRHLPSGQQTELTGRRHCSPKENEMDEQVLSLRDTLRIVLRCRRIVLVIALVGLLLGIAYSVAVPDLVSAKAEVLLPPAPYSSTGVPTRDVATEVDIVTSPTILNVAARPLLASSFRSRPSSTV